jgi:segregation and condensation protein A
MQSLWYVLPIMTLNSEIFTLENFEGPLDLLWHLINRQEIDIYQISLTAIIRQYLLKQKEFPLSELDRGAEFIVLAASLAWLKSKTLLPKHEQQSEQNLEEVELDPHFEIIHHLIDYSRFKQAAKDLAAREQQQGAFYARGIDNPEAKKNLGIEHLSLEDLASLFQQILAKAAPQKGIIKEEEWKVSDKISYLREQLLQEKKLLFADVFTGQMSRIELIVTFLALLELMKLGETKVVNDVEQQTICILATH